MCYRYLFTYAQCGCRKPLWDRFPCRWVPCCEVLLTRDVPMPGICTGCRRGRQEERKARRERLLDGEE